MIIRSIAVANWRCLLKPVEVGPFADGLNIIHAPNGTGKSSLFEALRRALLDGHRVSGRDVDALRPWGRLLSPKVTVEFVHGGTEYRVTKQFIDSQSSLLERRENGRYQPLAEGASSDEWTRALLSRNPPGRGLARTDKWGLAQILWAPQGNLALPALSDDLVTNVRSMLGAQVSGEEACSIERKIEERYLELYSPTGRSRSGKEAPRLARVEKELDEARTALLEAKELYQDFDYASRQVEDLRATRVQSGREMEEVVKALGTARRSAEAYRRLLAEKESRSERAKSAEARYGQLKQRIDFIQQTGKELSEARGTAATLEAEAPLKAREALERTREAERTRAALEDARKGRKGVDEAERVSDEARQFVEAKKAHAELDTRIKRVQQVQQALSEQKRKRDDLIAPDAKALRALRRAVKARDDAQVRLEASLIKLEVVPERDGRLDVVAGEQTGPVPLSAGVPCQVQGSPEVVADIPGFGRLRAWGPTGSVEDHRSEKAAATKKIERLTAPYGSSDVDALEALADEANQIRAAIAEAETQLETLLSNKVVEDLVQERNLRRVTLTRILEGHADWDSSPPDPAALKAAAEDVKRLFLTRVESAEYERDRAQGALTAAAGEEQTMAARIKDAHAAVVSLESKLADYTRDGKEMSARIAELEELAISWEAARARLSKIEEELTRYQDDPITAAEALQRQLEGTSAVAGKVRERELREETRLETLAARGPYSVLAAAEDSVTRLEEDVRGERLRMESIRLLRDTVADCRAEAVAAVAAPVEIASTRILQRIASRRLGRIQMGEGFQPSAVVPEATSESVGLENISGGEREQLYLATRLALAEVLAQDERQLVALDDVLTATDAGRLARVMTVLEEAAQRLQVLILTCHPERYRGLKDARFFDLEAILEDR